MLMKHPAGSGADGIADRLMVRTAACVVPKEEDIVVITLADRSTMSSEDDPKLSGSDEKEKVSLKVVIEFETTRPDTARLGDRLTSFGVHNLWLRNMLR